MVPRFLRAAVPLFLAIAAAIAPRVSAATSQIAITRFPSGIMQEQSGPIDTDDFVVANAGTDIVTVRVTGGKNFYTLSPNSFTLNPGTRQTVTIRPVVTAGGLYTDTAIVTIPAAQQTVPLLVPIRLFIGNRPVGTVMPVASTNQVIVSPNAGAIHSGSANIRNNGNVGMQGLVVTDVPWIVPQATNIVSIGSGGSTAMGFTVDQNQRPDSAAPLGAVVGNVSMIYLRGTANSFETEQSGAVSVQVIDISKASVATQQPPPLGATELAFFIPGILTETGGIFTDVFFSNRGTTNLSNVRVFFNAIGASPAASLVANVGTLPSNVAAWFPFAPSSLFNVGAQLGSLQVRSGDQSKMTISATRGVPTFDPNIKYLTALPVLTSGRSVGAGERLTFSGVEKSTTAHTDLVVQEAGGFAGSYSLDFFNAAGATVGTAVTGGIQPFGALNFPNSVPTGARSVRLSNTSSGSARLTGFATVVDESTLDAWTIVDVSRFPTPASELLLPLPATSGAPASTFDAWVTNASASAASVTVSTTAPTPPRRRSVKSGSAGVIALEAPTVLAAGETRRFPITSAPLGYVRITGPAGAITATGRFTSTVSGRPGMFGTGVPALPGAIAIGVSGLKRFSRSVDVPNASPATLLLLEAAQKPATVRVTIKFTFPAGATVSGQATASKDFDLAAGQLLTIPELAREILGPGRDTLGNLYNLVVDVQVVSGEGRVLPFMQTIDASGDLTFSAD